MLVVGVPAALLGSSYIFVGMMELGRPSGGAWLYCAVGAVGILVSVLTVMLFISSFPKRGRR